MRTLLTTSQSYPRDRFKFWQNAIFERIAPVELKQIDQKPFEGKLEGLDVGALSITRASHSPISIEATSGTIRYHDQHETISVILMVSGALALMQGGRESRQRPGELVILDRKPFVMLTQEHSCLLVLKIPRERLERMLGPVALYAGLTLGAEQEVTSFVANFFDGLTRIGEQLNADLANRLSSIGIDLLVAALAERMAQEIPKPLSSTLLFQRAKAYVEANLGDPTFDPSQLAIAMTCSPRLLQQVFQEHGESIADWIWRRRLEQAAARLSDPAQLYQSLGTLAYACGFISQSHFSRRFKDRYGMPPSDYRARVLGLRL